VQRIQEQFRGRIAVVVLAETQGRILDDLVEAEDELAWLSGLWLGHEGLTMPIAIWSGVKQPALFHGRRPTASPLTDYGWPHNQDIVLVDTHGTIRGYGDLHSRCGQAAVLRAIDYLLTEAAGNVRAQTLPITLVPSASAPTPT
jgi:hypothetical protein